MIRGNRILCASLLIAFLALAACSRRSSSITWARTLDEAKAKSGSSKLIIVDLFTDWCGWCKRMDVETWTDPRVAALQSGYVFLKLDAEHDTDGTEMQRKFMITGFPTVMILNPDGSEFDRLEGYLPADRFLSMLNKAVGNPEALGNLKAAEARDPGNLEIRFKTARKLLAGKSYEEAQSRFERIVSEDGQNKAGYTPNALFYIGIIQATRRESEQALATIDRLRGQFQSADKIPEATLFSGEILMEMGQTDKARSRIREFLSKYPKHRLAEQAEQLLPKP
jgi:thioredoxin-related protein